MTTTTTEPKVTIPLGEATYALADDFNAFCDLEEVFDLNMNGIIVKLGSSTTLSLRDVRKYLCTMLRSDGAALKPDHAANICQALGMEACNKAVSDHLLAHFMKE